MMYNEKHKVYRTMKDIAECGHPLYWHGCYRGTYDLIAPESVAHPAKMSPSLCYRILQHLKELGLLKDEDTILDPMAGTGMTNICAGALGYKSISVELEDKFVGFQKQNKDYAERRLYMSLDWQMIKGDSRKLSELLGNRELKSVTSPPYWKPNFGEKRFKQDPRANRAYDLDDDYGTSEGQIGNLKDTPLKSITSPPYGETLEGGGLAKKPPETFRGVLKDFTQSQGETEGQIGNLKDNPLKAITSPPYSEVQSGGGIAKNGYTGSKHTPTDLVGNRSYMPEVHGQSKGQIANLKDTPMKSITSPPYGDTGVGDWKTGREDFQEWVINEIKTKGYVEWKGKRYNEAEWRAMNHGRIDGRTTKGVHKHPTDGYSDNPENIGQLQDKPLKSIMSPPYGDAEKRDRSKEDSNEKEKDYPRGDYNISAGYQGSDDNIGKLDDKPLKSVMSPPHGLGKGTGHADNKRQTRPILVDRNVHLDYNDDNPDNIGNLSDRPLKSVMSPPYDNARNTTEEYDDKYDLRRPEGVKWGRESFRGRYGDTEGQIGKEHQESYLEAMQKVYSEIAMVSDVLVVVVKNPTRNKTIRRLDLDTIAILKQSGWDIHCKHRALLFEELEQADFFEGSKKQVKGRLSFFKRLSWQNGQPVASWEDIIVCVRR